MTNGPMPAPDRWLLLRQGKNAADYNMALDEALLQSAPQTGPPRAAVLQLAGADRHLWLFAKIRRRLRS